MSNTEQQSRLNEPLIATINTEAPNEPSPDKRPVLTTNRKKAIFFQQIFCLTFATYSALLKYTMNEKRVNPLDICMLRTLVLFVFSVIMGYATGCNFGVA